MLPKKVPDDAVGAQTPETKPRVPFAVGDVANWFGMKVVVLERTVNEDGEPLVLGRSCEPPPQYLLRESELTPVDRTEPEV